MRRRAPASRPPAGSDLAVRIANLENRLNRIAKAVIAIRTAIVSGSVVDAGEE